MQDYTLEKAPKKAFLSRFSPKLEDFNALLVVYEVGKGEWRGFAHPYGETIEADSRDKALKSLRTLTEAYYASIKRYGFPSHLMDGGLFNLMDRKVFSWIVGNKDFMEQIHSEGGKADSKFCYAETFRVKS